MDAEFLKEVKEHLQWAHQTATELFGQNHDPSLTLSVFDRLQAILLGNGPKTLKLERKMLELERKTLELERMALALQKELPNAIQRQKVEDAKVPETQP